MARYRVDDEVIRYATSMPGDAQSIQSGADLHFQA